MIGKGEILKCDHFEEQHIHYSILKANGKQSCLYGHSNVKANSESITYYSLVILSDVTSLVMATDLSHFLSLYSSSLWELKICSPV